MNSFHHVNNYAKRHVVERLMRLVGRGKRNPAKFRTMLEAFELETLSDYILKLIDG